LWTDAWGEWDEKQASDLWPVADLLSETREVTLVDEIMKLFAQAKQAWTVEAAIMGAKFGNAAFRQYNIANPTKPINLDETLRMGVEQAIEWAKCK